MFTVYEIWCKTPNHVYVGQTQNLADRKKRHRTGNGAEFVWRHGIDHYKIVLEVETREDAKFIETFRYRELLEEGYIVGGPYSTDILGKPKPKSDALAADWRD